MSMLVFGILSIHNAYANEQKPYFCGPDNPEEARSIDSIISTVYKTVSGEANSPKNWSLLKKLHSPQAAITPVFHDKNGEMQAKPYTVEEFIELNKKIFKDQGFFESEAARKTYVFGHMANVLSEYESRKTPSAEPYARGVNSFQFLNDGRRWCIISVTWDSDNKTHPLVGWESPNK